jgi:hypothetical protein
MKKKQNKIAHLTRLKHSVLPAEEVQNHSKFADLKNGPKLDMENLASEMSDLCFKESVEKLEQLLDHNANNRLAFEKALEPPKSVAGFEGFELFRRPDNLQKKKKERFVLGMGNKDYMETVGMFQEKKKMENDDLEDEDLEDEQFKIDPARLHSVDRGLMMQYESLNNRFGSCATRIMPKKGIQNTKYI